MKYLFLFLLAAMSASAADVESYYGRPKVGIGVLDIVNDKILFSDTSAPAGQKFKTISPYNLGVAIGSGGSTNWASPGAIGSTDPNAGSFTILEASTPLGVASGGLGVSLVDPGADRVLFWDDSVGAYAYLSLGTNLSITGTTLNASGGAGSGDVATDTLWDAAGDLVYGTGANTSARLPIGTAGQMLKVNAGATALEYSSDLTPSTVAVSGSLSTPSILLNEGAAPATPAANKVTFYAKADGLIYGKDDAGTETLMSNRVEIQPFAASDETTAITTGAGKFTWRAPFALTITGVRASLTTASSSGIPTIDINESGTTILSTKLTVDASEKTSTTAAAAAVISDSAIADDAEITVDIDVAGTGATGVKVTLYYTR